MPFQSVPDTVEMDIRYLSNGETCTMTFYGQKATGYDQTDVEALAEQGDAWAQTFLKPLMSNQVTYLSAHVRGLSTIVDLEAENGDATGVGGVTTTPMPNILAFCVKRNSAFTGRSARGRVYMPITLANLAADENLILTAAADLYAGALNAMRINMFVAGFTEVIVSRVSGGSYRPLGVTFQVVSYTWVDNIIDSQRRRRPSTP